MSTEKRFHHRLRSVANNVGFLVVNAEPHVGAVAILQATRPAAVLLDLDLPDQAAWQIAERILGNTTCPPVLLITGGTARFDMRTAVRAGSLVSKRESPEHIWGIIEETLELPQASQGERNEIQRVLLRWLRPSAWVEPTTPAYRHWGINE